MVCQEMPAPPSEAARARQTGAPAVGGTIIAAPNPRRAVSHIALADTLMSGDAGDAPASEQVGAFFGDGSRADFKAQLGSLTVLGESVDEDKLPVSGACRTAVTDDESGYGTNDDDYARASIDGSAILMDIGAFSDDGEEFDDDDDDDDEDDEHGDLVVLELQRRAHGGEPLFAMGSPPQRCAVDPCDELICSPPLRCAGPAPAAEPPCAAADRAGPALATLLAYSDAPIAAASPVGCGGGRGARGVSSGLACSLLAVSAAAVAPTPTFAHAAAMGEHCGAPPYPAAAYGGYGGVVSPPPVADPRLLAHHTRGRYRFGARPRLAASA